jgi:hypothetical protein
MTAGYVASSITNNAPSQVQGNGTGLINLEIIDPSSIQDQNSFQIVFNEDDGLSYSVLDEKEVSDTLTARLGNYHKLSYKNIDSLSFKLIGSNGALLTSGVDYDLLDKDGQILIYANGAIVESEEITAKFIYYPIVNSKKLSLEEGNPIFDGMTLSVQNQSLALEEQKIGWNVSSSTNWEPTVKPFNNLGANKYPADYELRWFSDTVSSNYRPGYEYVKANFEIWETTRGFEQKQLPFVLIESAPFDSLWNPGERIIILQDSTMNSFSWELTFDTTDAPVSPSSGDIFSIFTTRSFSDDEFTFTTSSAKQDKVVEKDNMDDIYVVPNPYVVSSNIEPLDLQNPLDRGPRRVYFANIPANCTIDIYTISGEIVKSLKHDSAIEDGIKYWDLTTSDNFPVSFGMYIYHVKSEDGNESTGRFAIIK